MANKISRLPGISQKAKIPERKLFACLICTETTYVVVIDGGKLKVTCATCGLNILDVPKP